MKKCLEIISLITCLLMILGTIIGSALISYGEIGLNIFSYFLVIIGGINLVLYILSKIKNFHFSIYEYFIFLLIILAGLSMINAISSEVALYGNEGRNEGLLVILSYYTCALNGVNLKNKKFQKIIIYAILGYGFINFIYGLMQIGFIKQSLIPIVEDWYYARGFEGNSMFFASLISMCYGIGVGLFLNEKDKKKNILYLLLVIIFSFANIISGSMALFVGTLCILFLSLIIYIVRLIKKDNVKSNLFKLFMCFFVFGLSLLIVCKFNEPLATDIKELFSQAEEVTEGNVEDDFGTGRIYIWRMTIPKVLENPWVGIGIDNYSYAFYPPVISSDGLFVDKAHNEYLQIMLCEGIFCGIVYIVFLLKIFRDNIVKKNNLTYALFLGFTCYAIVAFFGISVIRVTPIFFLLISLLISKKDNDYEM